MATHSPKQLKIERILTAYWSTQISSAASGTNSLLVEVDLSSHVFIAERHPGDDVVVISAPKELVLHGNAMVDVLVEDLG